VKTFSVTNLDEIGNARLTGATLARKVKKMSVAQRSALAARLQYWDVSLTGLLPKQAAALAEVAIGSVRLAGSADEADLAALKRGQMSLRQLRNKYRKAPTEIDIQSFILRVGPAAILNVLDRMTSSTRVVAAAE
jgi:hypothetical protein